MLSSPENLFIYLFSVVASNANHFNCRFILLICCVILSSFVIFIFVFDSVLYSYLYIFMFCYICFFAFPY